MTHALFQRGHQSCTQAPHQHRGSVASTANGPTSLGSRGTLHSQAGQSECVCVREEERCHRGRAASTQSAVATFHRRK
eukprot:4372680-Pleurochrysis_carterae.AAC.1